MAFLKLICKESLFLSSRLNRQGHGVGLALAHRVITEHGGTLTVANGADGGALFTIRLPQ